MKRLLAIVSQRYIGSESLLTLSSVDGTARAPCFVEVSPRILCNEDADATLRSSCIHMVSFSIHMV